MIKGLSTYTGTYCETVMCQNEPKYCTELSSILINDCALSTSNIQFLCPVLCGKCKTTTTTKSPCIPTPCLHGSLFHSELCRCSCWLVNICLTFKIYLTKNF